MQDAREQALARYRAGETDIAVEHKAKLTDAGEGLAASTIQMEAAREAVMQLGLIKPEAIPAFVSLMRGGMVEHPRSVTTAYRKEGEQLSRDEKKVAGIRANAFMSRQAFDELSDAGKAIPLTAHETTLLRAVFTENRFRRIAEPIPDSVAENFVGFKYDTLTNDCPFCRRVNGTIVQAAEVAVLPSSECVCPTANYTVGMSFDWLKNIT